MYWVNMYCKMFPKVAMGVRVAFDVCMPIQVYILYLHCVYMYTKYSTTHVFVIIASYYYTLIIQYNRQAGNFDHAAFDSFICTCTVYMYLVIESHLFVLERQTLSRICWAHTQLIKFRATQREGSPIIS